MQRVPEVVHLGCGEHNSRKKARERSAAAPAAALEQARCGDYQVPQGCCSQSGCDQGMCRRWSPPFPLCQAVMFDSPKKSFSKGRNDQARHQINHPSQHPTLLVPQKPKQQQQLDLHNLSPTAVAHPCCSYSAAFSQPKQQKLFLIETNRQLECSVAAGSTSIEPIAAAAAAGQAQCCARSVRAVLGCGRRSTASMTACLRTR